MRKKSVVLFLMAIFLTCQPLLSLAAVPGPPDEDPEVHMVILGGGCSECGPCTGTYWICDQDLQALLDNVWENCNPDGTYIDVYFIPCDEPT